MSERKVSVAEILDANRRIIYAILSLPYIGMFIAAGLIWLRKPDNMIITLGVIFFLMVQYGLTVYFLIGRINSMVRKKKTEAATEEFNKGTE